MSSTSDLDNFIEKVIELSRSGSYREIVEWDMKETIDMLAANKAHLNTALLTFNLKDHSLGVLYLLLAKFETATQYSDEVLLTVHLKTFVNNCSVMQMRIALDMFYELCHKFTKFISHSLSWHQGINILDTAIEKIRQNGTQMTPIHADLFDLSLKTKFYKTALKHLNMEVNAFYVIKENSNSDENNKELKYHLLYFLYGGMIYVAVKSYDRALHFFEEIFSNPEATSPLMDLMITGYNKFILVSLIVYGKIAAMPEDVEDFVDIHFKTRAEPYYALANAYTSGSIQQFTTTKRLHDTIFQLEDNIGLIKDVKLSLVKKDILQVLENYPSVSLSDIQEQVGLVSSEEAEEFIRALFESGEVTGFIDHTQGLVISNPPIALPELEYDDDIIC